jgi:hypothetical protein
MNAKKMPKMTKFIITSGKYNNSPIIKRNCDSSGLRSYPIIPGNHNRTPFTIIPRIPPILNKFEFLYDSLVLC